MPRGVVEDVADGGRPVLGVEAGAFEVVVRERREVLTHEEACGVDDGDEARDGFAAGEAARGGAGDAVLGRVVEPGVDEGVLVEDSEGRAVLGGDAAHAMGEDEFRIREVAHEGLGGPRAEVERLTRIVGLIAGERPVEVLRHEIKHASVEAVRSGPETFDEREDVHLLEEFLARRLGGSCGVSVGVGRRCVHGSRVRPRAEETGGLSERPWLKTHRTSRSGRAW